MHQNAVYVAYVFQTADIVNHEIRVFGQKPLERVSLVFVNQRHGSTTHIHQGHQPFPAPAENVNLVGLRGVQILAIHSPDGFPVNAVEIWPDQNVFPIIHVLKHRISRFDRCATCSWNKKPFEVEPPFEELARIIGNAKSVHYDSA